MSNSDTTALMTIDLKWSRFRIHKATLHKLKDHEYIQFLINPEEMFIAILGSDKPLTGGTANKVRLVEKRKRYSIDFHSNLLLEGLVRIIGTIDPAYSYRLSGEVDEDNRIAYFSLHTLKRNERRPPKDGAGI